MVLKKEYKVLLGISLAVILAYFFIDFVYMKPLIHQETAMALLMAKVKYGGVQITNGDPWWSVPPETYDFAPQARLWVLHNLNRLIADPHFMAAGMSILYSVISLWCWFFLSRRLKIDTHLSYLFCLWAILPFSYDRWAVGLPQGFKDISFMVMFTPLILGNLYEFIRTDDKKHLFLTSIACGMYFLFHPSLALLFLEVPFGVLLLYSARGRIIRNLLGYLIPLSIIAVPYLYFLCHKPLAAAIPYEEFIKIHNYRFHILFPDNRFMANAPIVSKYLKLSARATNYFLAFFGVVSFVMYWILAKKKISKFLLFCGISSTIACGLFLGNKNLVVLAAFGWMFRLRQSKYKTEERWIAFLPLILGTLSHTMQAVWAVLGNYFKQLLIDNQFLLYLFMIPWVILGAWFFLEPLARYVKNRVFQYGIMLIGLFCMHYWFWMQQVGMNKVVAIEICIAGMYWLLLEGLKKKHASISSLAMRYRTQGVAGLVLVLAFGGIVCLKSPSVVGKAREFIQKIPYGDQKRTADIFWSLSDAVEKYVPEDARFFTAPYAIRFMNKRFVYWTAKDANVYLYSRDWEKTRQWFELAQRFDSCKEPKCLAAIMRETESPYIILEDDYHVDPAYFEVLYDQKKYKILRIK